jgi:hypothetical protein
MLEEMLFLGAGYEAAFDRFEVLYALEYAYQLKQDSERVSGPVGRFAWKKQREDYGSPIHAVLAEAAREGIEWGPVKAGLFGGSIVKFNEVASGYIGITISIAMVLSVCSTVKVPARLCHTFPNHPRRR